MEWPSPVGKPELRVDESHFEEMVVCLCGDCPREALHMLT